MLENINTTASTGPSSSSDGICNKRKRRPAGTPGM